MKNKPARVHPPAWWVKMISILPQWNCPGLEPKTWTVELAERWIRAIPSKCPFERAVHWRGRLVLYIPPLCPLNPFSTQLYKIKINAQEYLLSRNADNPSPP